MRCKLHHVALSVRAVEESVLWYREVLGFEVTKRVDVPTLGVSVVFLEVPGFRLELFCFNDAKPVPEHCRKVDDDIRVQGTKHFALEVDDIQVAIRAINEKGVTEIDGPHLSWSGDNLFAFFPDPNGILIELFQYLPDPRKPS